MKDLRLILGELFLQQLKSKGVSIDERYRAMVSRDSIEIVGVGEYDDKRIFGSDINLYNFKEFSSEDRAFKIGAGSMGGFDLTCQASVMKTLAMAEFVKNFEIVKKVTTEFNNAFEVSIKK